MSKPRSPIKIDMVKIQTTNQAREQTIGEYATIFEEQVHAEVNHSRLIMKISGFHFNPTVVPNVKHDMAISQEGVFGHVSSILSAKNHVEAIRFANDNKFSPGTSMWSESFAKEMILHRI